ncbi:hypothetical protein [Candidatus Thioglobus sp.]|uniref:hypothetical protein n=1 Tax=Candidatus Thioglobus sp. TaxID=2026721 RepID=UPI00260A8057|nr:hypothetical protein [Candidatus Thioglobus sp.]MDG2395313.1 hypothetical protein [Candidatus Thioglobus sp.]
MKKIITASLMVVALNASAGFGNGPWGNNGWNNANNNVNNGIIAHNPYSMMTPDWFGEEMDDMMDEFDIGNNTPWDNKTFNNRGPWNNKNFNNRGPWSNNNNPWQNRNWNQGPWGNSQPFNFRNNSFGPMNNGPWNYTNTPTTQTK